MGGKVWEGAPCLSGWVVAVGQATGKVESWSSISLFQIFFPFLSFFLSLSHQGPDTVIPISPFVRSLRRNNQKVISNTGCFNRPLFLSFYHRPVINIYTQMCIPKSHSFDGMMEDCDKWLRIVSPSWSPNGSGVSLACRSGVRGVDSPIWVQCLRNLRQWNHSARIPILFLSQTADLTAHIPIITPRELMIICRRRKPCPTLSFHRCSSNHVVTHDYSCNTTLHSYKDTAPSLDNNI